MTTWPVLLTTVRRETGQGCGMGGFRDRGARRQGCVVRTATTTARIAPREEGFTRWLTDRANANQGVPRRRRSRRVVSSAG